MTVNQPQEMPSPMLVHVDVTNGTQYPIEDMFDGIPVVFPVGQTVTVGPDVAKHCFGYPGDPREMAVHMAKRYGWATSETLKWTSHKTPEFVEMASKVTFQPVFYDLVRRKPQDPIPAVVSDEEIQEPPIPSPASTTVVGKSRRYANASRAKRKETESKPRSGGRAGKDRRGSRVPHLNVREA